MKKAILGAERDNVVTCCEAVEPGDMISVKDISVSAVQAIPIYHKMAVSAVKAGEQVFKYGQPIGIASKDILPGEHVHIHNLESDRGRGDREGEKAR